MIIENNKIFKNAQLELAGKLLKNENLSVQMSSLIQIWAGMRPKQKITLPIALLLLFINFMGVIFLNNIAAALIVLISLLVLYICYYMQEEFQGLNIQLSTGEVYTFLSDNKDFINQVYQIITKMIAHDDKEYDYLINFVDYTITDNLIKPEEEEIEIEEAASEEPVAKPVDHGGSSKVIAELEQLYFSLENESESNYEALALIEQAMLQVDENDRKGMKESFEEFIKSGIINQCNQLGLNMLIDEIRNSMF